MASNDATAFRALADATHRQILQDLRLGELAAGDIAARSRLSAVCPEPVLMRTQTQKVVNRRERQMNRVPTMVGVIERRLLVTYRVDLEVLDRLLPPPFRPRQSVARAWRGSVSFASDTCPARLPAAIRVTTQNAAHRVAVEWDGPLGYSACHRGGTSKDSNSVAPPGTSNRIIVP